jgi:hypothetical protein
LENLKVRDHLGDREVDKKVILRWIFEKNVWVCVECIHVALERDQWQAFVNKTMNFAFHNRRKIYCLAKWLRLIVELGIDAVNTETIRRCDKKILVLKAVNLIDFTSSISPKLIIVAVLSTTQEFWKPRTLDSNPARDIHSCPHFPALSCVVLCNGHMPHLKNPIQNVTDQTER